jgi:hypothetical protein
MRLEPTGRNPRHYTVSFDDLKDGVQRLVSCPQTGPADAQRKPSTLMKGQG